jgi:hypothetical protein
VRDASRSSANAMLGSSARGRRLFGLLLVGDLATLRRHRIAELCLAPPPLSVCPINRTMRMLNALKDSSPCFLSATASSDNEIEYSVNHMVAPKCIIALRKAGVEGGRYES